MSCSYFAFSDPRKSVSSLPKSSFPATDGKKVLSKNLSINLGNEDRKGKKKVLYTEFHLLSQAE